MSEKVLEKVMSEKVTNESPLLSPLAAWFGAHSRSVGFLLWVSAWGLASWGYVGFLRDAAAHHRPMMAPGTFALLVGAGLLGLILLLGGRRSVDTLRRKGLGHMRYWAFIVCCLILPSFLAFMWLRHQLTVFGYD